LIPGAGKKMIYTEALKKRDTEKMERIRSEALERAGKVALLLKGKYGAKRVIIFGSVVRKAYIHERSDIDLLVEGINKEDFLRAGFDACAAATPFNVDIIPIETAHDYIVASAIKEGMEL
jgi:predicted nucleotidyltransferase